MNIPLRIKEIVSKVIFCYRITANTQSFFSLIGNSKKLRWSKNSTSIKKSYQPFSVQVMSGKEKRTLFLRTYEGDTDIFFEVFYKQVYKLSPAIFNEAKMIVDLGSNMGLSAIFFLNSCKEAKLICMEPDPDNFMLLNKNLVSEINTGRVKTLQAAAMDYDGKVRFSSGALKYNGHISKEGNAIMVKAISINSLFKKFDIMRVDLMKIDIEGAEKIIFSGDCSWLEKVTHIIVECHSPEDYSIMNFQLQRYHFFVSPLINDPGNQQLYLAVKKS